MRFFLTGMALLLASVSASAQTREQHVKWCTDPDSAPDLRIGECTALIQSGK
jgi:hypothetical protein